MLSNQANKKIIIQHIYSTIAPKPWTNWKKRIYPTEKKKFPNWEIFFSQLSNAYR